MLLTLAAASLRRHRTRTLLAVLGVAVSAALLLDMVMLASGMRESFRRFLLVEGFQLRITPKGTLPFDTDATIGDASAILDTLARTAAIDRIAPVLGAQLHLLRGERSGLTSRALGIDPARQGDYELLRGHAAAAPDTIVANAVFLRQSGVRVGDTLDAAVGFDPQLRTYAGRRRLVVGGEARFYYMPTTDPVIALPIATLQAMGGPADRDRVSLVMARVRPGVDVEQVRRRIERELPRVTAISISTAITQVDERLKYFRQLAFILGAISLVVGFLLVTTLVTVSVNERIGEIAVLRAIGVARGRVVQQIVLEGVALNLAGGVLGLALGLVTARWLNRILSDFPGLPASFDFFLFQPVSAGRALALLVVSGILAGVYPSWRASALPIAGTLRREAVA